MLLYAITNRHLEGRTLSTQREALIARTRLWAESGVDVIQLREKDLEATELISLAKAMHQAIRDVDSSTRLIVNAPLAIALAAKADGLHMPVAAVAYSLFIDQSVRNHLWLSAACHTQEQVEAARNGNANCILFAPVFEKQIAGHDPLHGVGMDKLASACTTARPIPVLALGGVTAENAGECVAAGASGIAAIRLFYGAPSAWECLR